MPSTCWSSSRLFRDGGEGILVGEGDDEDATGDEADLGMGVVLPASVVFVTGAVGSASFPASGFVTLSISDVVPASVMSSGSVTVSGDGDDAEGFLVKGDGIDVRSRRERYDGDRDSIKIDELRTRIEGKDGLFLVEFLFDAVADDDFVLSPLGDAIDGGGMLRSNGLDGEVVSFVFVSDSIWTGIGCGLFPFLFLERHDDNGKDFQTGNLGDGSPCEGWSRLSFSTSVAVIAIVGFNGLGDSNAWGAKDKARDTGFGICDGDGAFNPGLT